MKQSEHSKKLKKSIARPTDGAAAEQNGEGKKGLSSETVLTLSKMIKDLEDQLDRMLAINQAMESDLVGERKQRGEIEREIDRLTEELRQAGQEAAGSEDLRAEIDHLTNERSRLASTIEELGRQLASTEEENRKLSRLEERLCAERDDSIEELQSVEAQFDRAMEMVADLRTRLVVLSEERDAFKGRMKMMEEKLRETEEERDALLAEVEESRVALEDIRRSLVDACVLQGRSGQEDAQAK